MIGTMVHLELWSEDPATTGDSCAKTLGWKVEPVPQMGYWTVDPDCRVMRSWE